MYNHMNVIENFEARSVTDNKSQQDVLVTPRRPSPAANDCVSQPSSVFSSWRRPLLKCLVSDVLVAIFLYHMSSLSLLLIPLFLNAHKYMSLHLIYVIMSQFVVLLG